ncbi:NADH-quinone oxidoreductase subunit H [Coraliomargarita sp. SDUM461004]|uniref:NADH-quinone oxidoreductase subunit H n=1 Tax=Thalassobacterium sedimentorum TaxID=3041258 RepID=A0ABU1AH38_9BACT|nr:complex I subunit 1 family protein [Coraliomargarita sp. SDUM461004]MDQ8194126.1 NADH-quinone oxidoreductase subunit H [Coraliomargarita sp. SDUM461004]
MEFLDASLPYIMPIVYAVLMISVFMGLCSYSVLAERKVSSWIQGRVGPNRTRVPLVGHIPILGNVMTGLGLFQPVADGLKFLFKEEIVPGHVNKGYYYLAPIIALAPALTTMVVLPFGRYVDADGITQPLVLANVDLGMLIILGISSLGVYGIVLAGWSSNSKYPFLGGVRASAQMISYELAMGLALLPVFMWAASPGYYDSEGLFVEGSRYGMSLFGVVQSQQAAWTILWQPLSALLFLVALFAETNRLPFDMAESETDLVGGFHTEYGCFKFGLFFVAEYAHIIMGSGIFVLLFLGGWNFLPWVADPWGDGIFGSVLSVAWFMAKVFFMIFFFIWMRWTLPRFRYDQVMSLGWKILLPLAVGNLVLNTIIIALYDTLTR